MESKFNVFDANGRTVGVYTSSDSSSFPYNSRDVFLTSAALAKSLGTYQRLEKCFADGYYNSDGINTGSSSSYMVDASSKYLTTAGNGSGGSGGSSTDGTINSTASTGLCQIDRSWSLTAGDIITQLGHKTDSAMNVRVSIFQRTSANNYTNVANTGSVAHGGAGWQDFTLSSPYTVPSSGTFHVGTYSASAIRYPNSVSGARSYIFSDITTSSGSFTEDSNVEVLSRATKLTGAAANMTVLTTSQIPYTAPTLMKVIIEAYPVDAITLNTDLTAEVTANNGSNYTTGTLTLVGDTTAGAGTARKIYETNEINVSSVTGTSGLWARIKTLNTKQVRIYRTCILWM